MILLDTHVVTWVTAKPSQLSPRAAAAIRRARTHDGVAIAAISLWELAFLFSRGRLRAPGTIDAAVRGIVEEAGASIKPITLEVAALAAQFPDDFPHDPVDRLIAATARAEGMTLITRDERIRQSPLLKTLW